MADGTGQKRKVKGALIGPEPVSHLVLPVRAGGGTVKSLFNSRGEKAPWMVKQLTDLAREAWLNLSLKGMGKPGQFEFIVIPPKPAEGLPSEMLGPSAEDARRGLGRVFADKSVHETLPLPHAFGDWIIKFVRISYDRMHKQSIIDQLRNVLDQVKAEAKDDAGFTGESATLLEDALGELRMPMPEIRTILDSHEPLMSAQETIKQLQKLREREAIQSFLDRFVVGKTWGNVDDDQIVADGVTAHLQDQKPKLRVACTSDGEPSRLRCYQRSNAKVSKFIFEHFTDGSQRKHGGSPTVPELRIVPEGPDRRRKSQRITEREA